MCILKQKYPVILASGSKRRKQLLNLLGLKFKVVPPDIKENLGKNFSVRKLKKIAVKKVNSVAKRFKEGLIIGADTIVVVNKKIYGKPKNLKDAKKMLRELSGKKQQIWSAVAVKDIRRNKLMVKTARSKIQMKKLSEEDINFLADKNLDKAGAYGIQEDDKYLKVLSGSYTNIVGFPMEIVKKILKKFVFSGQLPI